MAQSWSDQYDRAVHNAASQMNLWDGFELYAHVDVQSVGSWKEFQDAIADFTIRFRTAYVTHQWLFRGQGNSQWALAPSLERLTVAPLPRLDPTTNAVVGTQNFPQDAFYAEYDLLR